MAITTFTYMLLILEIYVTITFHANFSVCKSA